MASIRKTINLYVTFDPLHYLNSLSSFQSYHLPTILVSVQHPSTIGVEKCTPERYTTALVCMVY